MTDMRLFVRMPREDVLVGTLYSHRRRGVESTTFIYAASYLNRPDAYALDPELPLVGGSLHSGARRPLFGALTDCAPDRWGRTLLTRRELALARAEKRAARSLGEVDYLLGVRDDLRQGAVRLRIENDGPFLADDDTDVPALTDLPGLMDLAQRAETDASLTTAFAVAGFFRLNDGEARKIIGQVRDAVAQWRGAAGFSRVTGIGACGHGAGVHRSGDGL